ncbi:hypothetical protein J2W17_003062 [Pseudomonas lini]|nr:hypothetical protein [Pseudomonas lini]
MHQLRENPVAHNDLWRGGLPPLGCEAAPFEALRIVRKLSVTDFLGGCATQRGQSPLATKNAAQAHRAARSLTS